MILLQIKQNTCLIEFQIGQYMGHAWEQLLLGRETYPSKPTLIYNSSDATTWLQVLLKCKQQQSHLGTTKLLISNKIPIH